MKLSIIVPVYNAEKYLHKCVDSLLAQTIDDYEVILINDGSKDGSEAILREYAERYPNVICYKTVENGGQGRARNIGVDMARGEYIGFVDSDDWIKPEMYEVLYNTAIDENADVVVCDIEEHYSDHVLYVDFTSNENRASTAGSACNKLFKRKCIGEMRFPVGVWYEDFEFSTKVVLHAKKLAFLHEAPYCYRIGEFTTMKNNNTLKNLDIITVMDNIRAAAGEGSEGFIEALVLEHVLLEAIKRVAAQNTPERDEVLAKLLTYVKAYIPKLSECAAYKTQPRNKKIIMWLNYHNKAALALKILELKAKIRSN